MIVPTNVNAMILDNVTVKDKQSDYHFTPVSSVNNALLILLPNKHIGLF